MCSINHLAQPIGILLNSLFIKANRTLMTLILRIDTDPRKSLKSASSAFQFRITRQTDRSGQTEGQFSPFPDPLFLTIIIFCYSKENP
jgi:hypothetical protein